MNASPPLWEVSFPLKTPNHGPTIAEHLEVEAVSCSWHENKQDPNQWDFQALFEDKPDMASLMSPLWKEMHEDPPPYALKEIPQQDWLTACYKNFPPLEIANFYLYGSHIETPSPGDRIAIKVDAATAFGSGEHETTEGCLKAIHQLSQDRQFTTPLDMGCGSGILAMAMAKTFDCSVLAVDNDPEAVKMTGQNALSNQLEDQIIPLLSEGFKDEALHLEGPYDLITANILAGPLCSMAYGLGNHLEEDGFVILSGLLTTQKEMVEAAYAMANCTLVDTLTIADWTTLIMRKKLHG